MSRNIILFLIANASLLPLSGCSPIEAESSSTQKLDVAQKISLGVIESGDEIQVSNPTSAITCSISVVSEDLGITAGHCGEEGAKVFAKGKEIGRIGTNYLYESKGADAAEVTLHPAEGYEIHPTPFSYDLLAGENEPLGTPLKIETYFGQTRQGRVTEGSLSCQSFSIDSKDLNAYVLLSDIVTRSGDSGAPVYSDSNELIGIVQGGNGNDKSSITPLTFLDSQKWEAGILQQDTSHCD